MGRKFIRGGGLVLLLAAVFSWESTRAEPPENFQNETFIASGLTFATAFEFLPDGRMLVTEFRGKVLIVQAGATTVDPTPVLQLVNVIDEDVQGGGERGLVNVLADPNFLANGYFYLFYTAGSPQRDRVSRFTLVGNTASLASEVVIWQGVADSTSTDHHGGGMLFGLDGKFYISTGDNGSAATSQALNSDHGKILRINPNGTVPTDNPFFDGAGPNLDAIWARGCRNPFRISLDPPTGRIYIGDVGELTFEEVNLGAAGANYGWPTCDGPCSTTGMTNPIFSYSRAGRDGSVTGGFVYRGNQFPASYQGVYFYGDYSQNWIRYLTFDGAGDVTGSVNFEPEDGSLDNESVGDPVMLKMGSDGALYYLDIGSSQQQDASIRRIRYTAVNQPPEVNISGSPLSGPAPLTVDFSSAGSFDPEGQPLSYLWTFGDGMTSTAANPTHLYQQEGPYTVRLALSDGVNTTQSSVLVVSVGNAPTGTITSPPNGQTFRAGDIISFSGTASDLEDGTLPASAFSWTVVFHHETHIHPAMGPVNGVTSGTFTIPSFGHDFSGNTSYEIILKVTDSDGLQHISSVFFVPEKVNLSFNSVPAGLLLTIDGIGYTTPFVKDALVGFQYTINAANQIQGGSQYDFVSWSDGGAQSHIITVPTTALQYTATYQVGAPLNQIVALPFSEGSGTTTVDSSGSGHNGTLVNGPSWTTGKYGNGLSFDGTNDYVSVANPSTINLGTSDFTIATWVKRQATGVEHNILSKTANTGFVSGGKEFFISGVNNTLTFGGHSIPAVQSTGTITNDGLWHYVTATFVDSSNTLRLYIDGTFSGTGNINLSADVGGHVIKIGSNPAGAHFRGVMDEFRIFSRVLSQSEIQNLMNATGLPSPTPTATATATPTATATSTATATATPTSTATSTSTATPRSTATPTPTPTSFPTPTPSASPTIPPNQVAAFLFNEGNGTTTVDSSGSGHTGTLVNGPTWTAGKYGSGVSFDGTNDYVSVANSGTIDLGTSDFTIAAWVKRQANGVEHNILSKTASTAWVSAGKEFFISGTDNTLAFGSHGTGAVIRSTATITNDGLWHYVAATFVDTSNTMRLYIDGNPSGTGTINLAPDVAGHVIKIGSNPGGVHFSGVMDEVRVFSRALSQSEIQSIMNGTVSPSPTPTPTPTPAPGITGSISYCSSSVPGPVPNVTMTLTGSESGSTFTDLSGNYAFSLLITGASYTVTPTKAALARGSAGINTVDVIAVQSHFLNIGAPLSGCRLIGANVNADSLIDTSDVIAIQRFVLSLQVGIADVGEYKFTPASRTYPGIITDQTGQNYDALIFGDVASPFAEP